MLQQLKVNEFIREVMLVSCVVVSFNLEADVSIISLHASCQLLLILPTSRSRTYLRQNICTHKSHGRANI